MMEVAPVSHWSTMKAIILVGSAPNHLVASITSMQPIGNTSSLFAYRCLHVVPKSIEAMKTAIKNMDFEQFAAHAMGSNKFCAVRRMPHHQYSK